MIKMLYRKQTFRQELFTGLLAHIQRNSSYQVSDVIQIFTESQLRYYFLAARNHSLLHFVGNLGVNRLIFRTLSPKNAVYAAHHAGKKITQNLSRYIPRTEVNDLYIQVHEAPVSRTRGHTRRYWHRSL